jgi:tetratricopeptide (TPR) repeat protein
MNDTKEDLNSHSMVEPVSTSVIAAALSASGAIGASLINNLCQCVFLEPMRHDHRMNELEKSFDIRKEEASFNSDLRVKEQDSIEEIKSSYHIKTQKWIRQETSEEKNSPFTNHHEKTREDLLQFYQQTKLPLILIAPFWHTNYSKSENEEGGFVNYSTAFDLSYNKARWHDLAIKKSGYIKRPLFNADLDTDYIQSLLHDIPTILVYGTIQGVEAKEQYIQRIHPQLRFWNLFPDSENSYTTFSCEAVNYDFRLEEKVDPSFYRKLGLYSLNRQDKIADLLTNIIGLVCSFYHLYHFKKSPNLQQFSLDSEDLKVLVSQVSDVYDRLCKEERDLNAEIYYREEQIRFLEQYSSTESIDPNDTLVYTYNERGYAYYELKEYAKAISYYNRAIELDPNFGTSLQKSWCSLPYLKRIMKKLNEKAIYDFNKAIALDPNEPSTYCFRGSAYLELNEHKKAISDFNKAIELDPNHTNAYYRRGIAYCHLEEYEKAISDFNKAISLKSNDISYCYDNRGYAYLQLNEYEKAISDFNKAIELDPNYILAYTNRVNAYLRLNDYARVIYGCNKLIELDPTNLAYYNRGYAYLKLNEYEKAISDFNKAITLDTNYTRAYWNRALTYVHLNKYEKAISAYNKVIELDPDDKNNYYLRGHVYLQLQKYVKAASDFNKVIQLDPTNTSAYYFRELAYKSSRGFLFGF